MRLWQLPRRSSVSLVNDELARQLLWCTSRFGALIGASAPIDARLSLIESDNGGNWLVSQVFNGAMVAALAEITRLVIEDSDKGSVPGVDVAVILTLL